MATLDLIPKELDLKLYVGDDPRLKLTFWTDKTKTETVDLSDYTGWAASIKSKDGESETAFTFDLTDAADGVVILSLDGDTLRGFPHQGNRWDTKVIDPDGREVSLYRGRVLIVEDVTV